jgi:DNA-binding LacI/PurR family transcriptional regulator
LSLRLRALAKACEVRRSGARCGRWFLNSSLKRLSVNCNSAAFAIASCPASSTAAALLVARELLHSIVSVSTFVANNDIIDHGCLATHTHDEAGLCCLEDVSVIGCNDMALVERVG